MAAQVLSFFQRSPRLAPTPTDWSQQELAEFYRVEGALIRAGIRVGTDRGMSDENEPWFVFYRSDDGEVVIHFARIDGEYLIAGPAYEEIARGFDFTALVRNLVARHPLIRRSESGSNLSVHPAALLVAVVGTAFFKTGEARAAESGAANPPASHSRPVLLSSSSNAGLSSGAAPIAFQQPSYDSVQLPANQAVLILAAALLASSYQPDTAGMDPQTRAAIASAAAALDFSDMQTSVAHPGASGAATAVAHAVAIDNSPAQMVSSVLTLVTLMSSLPPSGEAPAMATASLGEVTFDRRDTVEQQTLQAPDLSHWAIDVRLSASDPSVVEAVQLVRGAVGDAAFQKISVIEVAKLPDALAQIIAKGGHYDVPPPAPPETTAPPPPPTTTKPPETPLPDDTSGGNGDSGNVEGGHSDGGNSDGGGHSGGGSVTLPPTTDVKPEPPTPPAPKPPPYSGFATQEMVRNFVDYFVAHTGSFDIITEGRDVVMFDSRVTKDPSAIHDLTSMTFHFFDGSSISLVGELSSFLHGGNLV